MTFITIKNTSVLVGVYTSLSSYVLVIILSVLSKDYTEGFLKYHTEINNTWSTSPNLYIRVNNWPKNTISRCCSNQFCPRIGSHCPEIVINVILVKCLRSFQYIKKNYLLFVWNYSLKTKKSIVNMVNILGCICKNILLNKLCILVNFQLESLKSFKSICLKLYFATSANILIWTDAHWVN